MATIYNNRGLRRTEGEPAAAFSDRAFRGDAAGTGRRGACQRGASQLPLSGGHATGLHQCAWRGL